MSLGPFDMTGGPFLVLYGVLLVFTIVAGFAIPRWLRPAGRETARTKDPLELAWLAGGQTRVADTVVARLLSSRALEMTGDSKFRSVHRDAARNSAEASVLTMPGLIGWGDMERALKSYAEPIERKLVSAGMAISAGTSWQLRFWQTTPYFLLLAFGAIKWTVGSARDKPVGFLTALLILTAVLALIRFLAVDRKTRAGAEALDAATLQSGRLRDAPTNGEMDVAVALFGTTVLVGSGYAAFHTLRNPSSSGDGGSGGDSGGDGGGGGCGGGGCGGCGG